MHAEIYIVFTYKGMYLSLKPSRMLRVYRSLRLVTHKINTNLELQEKERQNYKETKSSAAPTRVKAK